MSKDRKEYLKNYHKKYYLEHKEEILKKQKKYQTENKEKVSERHKKYNQKIKASNSILTELEEYLNQHIQEWENEEDEYMKGVVAEDKDIFQFLQELKEKY